MSGRRWAPRFSLAEALHGTLRILDRVMLEELSGADLCVISSIPAGLDEVVSLERFGACPPLALRLRVADREVVMLDGTPRHRLRLEIVDSGSPLAQGSLGGLLVKDIDVTLAEVSRDGCLLLSPSPVQEGARGEIAVGVNGHTCRDDVRVVRCVSIDEGASYRIAVEFVPTPAHYPSLRHRLVEDDDRKRKETA